MAVTAIVGLISATVFLGLLTLTARICPPRVEGMVFALLLAISNLGAASRSILGKLYETVGVFISAPFTALI